MQRLTDTVLRLNFEEAPGRAHTGRNGLKLAASSRALRGPDKYRALDMRRRRAQIRARRVLGLI